MGPASRVPVIGASGAIAGVLGGYFVLYPRGRITDPAAVRLIQVMEVPAVFYLLAWFAVQLYAGISAGAEGPLIGGVALVGSRWRLLVRRGHGSDAYPTGPERNAQAGADNVDKRFGHHC